MNNIETIQIMSLLKVAYPQYYNGMSKDDAKTAINLWAGMFEDDDFKMVFNAVKAFIATNTKGFPPSIGQIKERIIKMTCPETDLTEQDAWNCVRKALSNGYYGYMEEYAKLPESVQSAVGSPNVIKEWALLDTKTLDTVIASNFMRSYKVRVQNNKEYMALPSSVKGFVAELSGKIGQGLLKGGKE